MIVADVALVFVILAALGFIPGITTSFGKMRFANHRSGAELFRVSGLHNAIHARFGLVGLALVGTPSDARRFLSTDELATRPRRAGASQPASARLTQSGPSSPTRTSTSSAPPVVTRRHPGTS